MFHDERLKSLAALLDNMHRITGLKFALLDEQAREIYTASYQTGFCMQLKRAPGGFQRCTACDREMLLRASDGEGMYQYRCHAGLIEVAVPVTEGGRTVATILFGQLLDNTPMELQWQHTRECCGWHPAPDTLRSAFYDLRTLSTEEIRACAEIVHACVSEVRLQGLLEQVAQTDGDRLLGYIDRYYATDLSLDTLSRALSIGKTKLCAIAASESGMTVSRLIASRRVAVACRMLELSDDSIQQIAEAVGIPDYNYFSKVFKSIEGMTPSAYRKKKRLRADTPIQKVQP